MDFRPVRDPDTGRIDMVPFTAPEWGDFGRSEVIRSIFGAERYDALHPDDFDSRLETAHDLHDAGFIEVVSLLAPHVDHVQLGKLSRQWIDATSLVRDGTLRQATVAFSLKIDSRPDDNGHGGGKLIVMNATVHEIVLTMFCGCGDMTSPPVVYWNDNGRYSTGPVEPDQIDEAMTDSQIQFRRWDNTKVAVAAKRRQDRQPEGVVDMAAFRSLRAVKA